MTGSPQPEFIVSRDGCAVELRVQGETVFTFLSRNALESLLDRGQVARRAMEESTMENPRNERTMDP